MKDRPLIKLQENRDIGQVLTATFSFLRTTFKYVYKDIFLFASPFYIIPGILNAMAQFNIYTGQYTYYGGRFSIYSSPFYYLALLGSLVGWAISFTIVGNYVYQYNQKGSADFDVHAVRVSVMKDFFKVFITVILYTLSMILGCILLIIPGIYYAVANTLGPANIILNKNASIGNTFGESRRLIQDNWWRSLLLGIIIFFMIYVCILVLSMPLLTYSMILAFHMNGDPEKYRVAYIIFSGLAHFAYCLGAPVMVVASCIYYYSLREQKDQVSLIEKIDNLGNNVIETKANEGSY